MLKMSCIYGVTIILTIMAANIVTSEMTSQEIGEEEYADLMECKNETGASDMDAARLITRSNPITQAAKCLTACYLNKLGVMTNEKLIPENLSDFVCDVTLVGSNGKMLETVVKEIANECKAVSDADKCESAAKILICLNAAARKRGFCPNVF